MSEEDNRRVIGERRQEIHSLLARIDERTLDMDKRLEKFEQRLDAFEDKYVSVHQYKPVELIVYGLAGMTLITVFGAILTMVIIS